MNWNSGKLRFSIVLVVVFLIFVPIVPISIVPSISLSILDESRNPIPGLPVRQSWQHYTYQFSGDSAEVLSDSHGVARFPERTARISVGQLVLGQILKVVSINPHASFGPSSFFLSMGKTSGHVSYSEGEPIPTEIIVKF